MPEIRCAAFGFDLTDDSGAVFVVDVGDGHFGAFSGQQLGSGFPYAGSTAGTIATLPLTLSIRPPLLAFSRFF
jgi:hypothetical protein